MTLNPKLNFKPFLGLYSRHLQMIFSAYSLKGSSPPSHSWLVDIGEGDRLSCEVSIPTHWKANNGTIVLIHGLGGSHTSGYMIRMARKFYKNGNKIVRVNLRGCGSGAGLSKLPYSAGNSLDLLHVLQSLKIEAPDSEISVIGFSLGGNIVLKLAGELGISANKLVKTFTAVCPPLDLGHTVNLIQRRAYFLYHRYYLKKIFKQARPWMNQKCLSLYEFDDKITGPLWGFKGAQDYYHHCSSKRFLSTIQCETHLILAEDDPFVSINPLKEISLPNHLHVWTSKYGSHMGFLGRTAEKKGLQWLDHLLLSQSHLR